MRSRPDLVLLVNLFAHKKVFFIFFIKKLKLIVTSDKHRLELKNQRENLVT